jgi:hypothetical protein
MGFPVILNVYDLTDHNNWIYWCGIGIYHTGVEVNGIEYAYGGHDYDVSGVFATNPREAPGGGRQAASLWGWCRAVRGCAPVQCLAVW